MLPLCSSDETTEDPHGDADLGWTRLAIGNLTVSPREVERSSCSASPDDAGWMMDDCNGGIPNQVYLSPVIFVGSGEQRAVGTACSDLNSPN